MKLPSHLLQTVRLGGLAVLAMSASCKTRPEVTADPQAITTPLHAAPPEPEPEPVTEPDPTAATTTTANATATTANANATAAATTTIAPMGMSDPELSIPLKGTPVEAPAKPPAKISKRKPVVPPPSKIDPCMACGMG